MEGVRMAGAFAGKVVLWLCSEAAAFVTGHALLVDGGELAEVCDADRTCGADWGFLKNKIRDTLSEFFYERLKRRPVILPLVVEV